MKNVLMKTGLYALDLGAGLTGVGLTGAAGYGLLKLAGGLVPAIAGKFVLSTAVVGALVYPAAVCAFIGVVLVAKAGIGKLFNWTSGIRQEIREADEGRKLVMEKVKEILNNERIPLIDKGVAIKKKVRFDMDVSDELDEKKEEASYSNSVREKEDNLEESLEKTEQDGEIHFSVSKDDIEIIRNNKDKGKGKDPED